MPSISANNLKAQDVSAMADALAFDDLLERATQQVSHDYFQVPIAGRANPIYRERVYCYELYHQLRTIWPDYSGFSLGGEVDKSGHPLIRGNSLDNRKPDFLVHVPGSMQNNFVVMEVKPISARKTSIQKDIRTLSAFVTHANYERALYLFYGRSEHGKGTVIAEHELNDSEGSRIEIWVHNGPNSCARRLR